VSAPPCAFCAIAADQAPAEIVRRWPDALAIRPLNPVNDGHLLIIPVRHTPSAAHAPDLAGRTASYAAALVAEARWQANLLTSVGPAATQTQWHLHWHVIPRHMGDGLALPWTGQARP
jgi:histidine triad (HIT) family protein